MSKGALRELFIWCILSNKKVCARILWNALYEDLLAAAVVANSLLKSLAKESSSKDDVSFTNDVISCDNLAALQEIFLSRNKV